MPFEINCGGSDLQTGNSRRKRRELSQEDQLGLVSNTEAELPRSTGRAQPTVAKCCATETRRVGSRKRQPGDAPPGDSFQAKRARLAGAEAQAHPWPVRRSARLLEARQRSEGHQNYSSIAQSTHTTKPQTNKGARGPLPPSGQARSRPRNSPKSGFCQEKVQENLESAYPKPPPSPPKNGSQVEHPRQITEPKLSQKHQTDAAREFKHRPTRLTRKNLRLFDEMAKSSKKGSRAKSNAKSGASAEEETRSTKTASTTSSGFAARAFENGVLDAANSQPPGNLNELRNRLDRSRETASPPESAYKAYVHAVRTASTEATMIYETGKLLKDYDDTRYRKCLDQTFNAFPQNVGFNNGLSAPKPDMVEALQRPAFRPFPVKDELGGSAVLIDDPNSMTLPHLAAEWKARGKDMEEARAQSAYDGAALVYGRNQALAHTNKPDKLGQASIRTFTTDGSNINFFAHHAAVSGEDAEGETEYHQYPVTSTNLINSFEEFKKGRKQLRNTQDAARDESYALRDHLRHHWKTKRDAPSIAAVEDDDCLAATVEEPCLVPEQRPKPPRPTKPPRRSQTDEDGPPTSLGGSDDEAAYEIIEKPTSTRTHPQSSKQATRNSSKKPKSSTRRIRGANNAQQ